MKYIAKIVNGFPSLTIFAKSFILDVWKGSEYTNDLQLSAIWIMIE